MEKMLELEQRISSIEKEIKIIKENGRFKRLSPLEQLEEIEKKMREKEAENNE